MNTILTLGTGQLETNYATPSHLFQHKLYMTKTVMKMKSELLFILSALLISEHSCMPSRMQTTHQGGRGRVNPLATRTFPTQIQKRGTILKTQCQPPPPDAQERRNSMVSISRHMTTRKSAQHVAPLHPTREQGLIPFPSATLSLLSVRHSLTPAGRTPPSPTRAARATAAPTRPLRRRLPRTRSSERRS